MTERWAVAAPREPERAFRVRNFRLILAGCRFTAAISDELLIYTVGPRNLWNRADICFTDQNIIFETLNE